MIELPWVSDVTVVIGDSNKLAVTLSDGSTCVVVCFDTWLNDDFPYVLRGAVRGTTREWGCEDIDGLIVLLERMFKPLSYKITEKAARDKQ